MSFRLMMGVLIVVAFGVGGKAFAQDDWRLVRVPGFWEREHGGIVDTYDGYAWYRCFVKVPAGWTGQTLTLNLGRIDDCDETYFNGVKVGASGSAQPFRTASGQERSYAIEPEVVRYGEFNLIAVRVYDAGGAGGFGAGRPSLAHANGSLRLDGRWQFRMHDDEAYARWPVAPDAPAAVRLAEGFLAASESDIGQPRVYEPLPGTGPLTVEGDIASQLVAGVDRFLLREIEASKGRRAAHWDRDMSSAAAYAKSIEGNRERLAAKLGLVDRRVQPVVMHELGTREQPALVGRGDGFEVFAVRWPAFTVNATTDFGKVHGEGLLLVPVGRKAVADVVAIPDAMQTPEQIVGLTPGVAPISQYARKLAESGCRVLVPMLISRDRGQFAWNGRQHAINNREFLYRSAWEMGRTLVGYETQKVLAAVDWFAQQGGADAKIGVVGWGEGGMLALYAAALDPRIEATCVSGYFEPRERMWEQPIDRNVFGLLEEFGDAELASMIAPRTLVVEAARGPQWELPAGGGSGGGAPSVLDTPAVEDVRGEVERARELAGDFGDSIHLATSAGGDGPFASDGAMRMFLAALDADAPFIASDHGVEALRDSFDPVGRMLRQMQEIDRHTQWLLREGAYTRRSFMSKLDTSSIEKYEQTVEPYREMFYDEIVGRFGIEPLAFNPRTRKAYDTEHWTGYEVVLDVFEDVIAYGILLVPKDLKPGERRPVVVCQHGLEGRPQDTVGEPGSQYYRAFAGRLADRGFITFAPQNLYIFTDRFRTLQRKGNAIGKTLFSVIVPQHQQIVDWLETLPIVDPQRIAFYGLSYGGKTAMRVPPLVTDYCLSICSADFNEWVDKNASTRNPRSYVWGGEYEIFEWRLGETFNYAEMAALICPRPFMVERGHHDGVADDWTVAWEFAKIRYLYNGTGLNIGDRCEIEWFNGPHTIHGVGTYDFLHRHLNWPKPGER